MNARPLILLIFANDQHAYLDGIPKERQQLMELLRSAGKELGLEVDGLDYTTAEGVIKALNVERDRLAVLHFAGHSATDLLQLDEGAAHAQGLAAKLGACPNLKLVFLNGCNNATLVKAIADAGIPNVIGTRLPVADIAARHFSQGFFNALATQNRTITEAFRQAKADAETLTGQHHRSLDIRTPDTTPDWAWFMESKQADWRLADAALPCNRLPALPHGELPARPFKNLYYYTEADAEIFFGRCQAILDVMQLLDEKEAKEPILLLHGGTGVGKSSFLLAGLIPRLKAPSRQQTVHYLRYNELNRQQDLLTQLFGSTDSSVIQSRLNTPSPTGHPSIWIIDQLEEIFFDEQHKAIQSSPTLHTLLTTLHTVFYPQNGSDRPHAKFILSLRKEWFAEFHDACRQYGLNQRDYLLKPLDKPSIIEIIESPAHTFWLQQRYGLRIINPVNGSLAEQIADDLLSDKQSNIAPTLQTILFRLWERVNNLQQRIWGEDLYLDEKREGLLLEDYLNMQLQDIAEKESWGKEAKETGLLLDILYRHTSSRGVAKAITRDKFDKLYSHIGYRFELLESLKNHYLLIEPQTEKNQKTIKSTRLSHDTLAELVRFRFDKSDSPGQRARRILDTRKTMWTETQGTFHGAPLDTHDLITVKTGQAGTSNWRNDLLEYSIIKLSKKHRRLQIIKNTMTYSIFLFILITFSIIFLSLDQMRNHDKINTIEQSYRNLNIKMLDRPHEVKPEDFNNPVSELKNIPDKEINKEHKIKKYVVASRFLLVGSTYYKLNKNTQKSSQYSTKALANSKTAEQLMMEYGANSEFIKGGGNNRYLNLLFIIIHENAILYCNGNHANLDEAKLYIEKLSKISPNFIIEHKTKNDICFENVIQKEISHGK